MSKESRITALAIMKSMIESGHYRVPDDEFDSTLRGFVSLHERVAGPSEENQGGYRAVSPPGVGLGQRCWRNPRLPTRRSSDPRPRAVKRW